jgi:hypothetical protein
MEAAESFEMLISICQTAWYLIICALRMEPAGAPETLVTICQTTQHHIPEGHNLIFTVTRTSDLWMITHEAYIHTRCQVLLPTQ